MKRARRNSVFYTGRPTSREEINKTNGSSGNCLSASNLRKLYKVLFRFQLKTARERLIVEYSPPLQSRLIGNKPDGGRRRVIYAAEARRTINGTWKNAQLRAPSSLERPWQSQTSESSS